MKTLVSAFTTHIKEGLEIANTFQEQPKKHYAQVLITGLGGSGIGGKITAEVLSSVAKVPIIVNHDYTIPAFVNENTLVIACSYSGNTEETLEAVGAALAKGAQLAAVTSGGKLEQLCKEQGFPHITIPGGLPPRAAFGYSFPQLFALLAGYHIISKDVLSQFERAIYLLDTEEEAIRTASKQLADNLFGKQIIIYSSLDYHGVATRFRHQLNENSKVLCWHHALPEMNHNELVGWAGGDENMAVVQFLSEDDHPRTQERFKISTQIIEKYTRQLFFIQSKGASKIERTLYLIHFGDWVSCFLADLRGVDAIEVNVIDFLKGKLAEI